ncbi:MAG: ThiF family adenylyltransferase [Planctomycetota bacterium]
MKKFSREAEFRGSSTLQKLQDFHVVIAGAGALGSNLIEILARQGFGSIRLIDDDRVEEPNLGTQIYGFDDIGALKVNAARSIIFREVETEIEAIHKRLTSTNVHKLLRGADLVVDVFDNHQSRGVLFEHCASDMPCLHAGLFEGYGEVVWNADYMVPEDSEEDLCDYPLARNLINLVVSVAAEEIVDFASAETPRRKSWSITLKDLCISSY